MAGKAGEAMRAYLAPVDGVFGPLASGFVSVEHDAEAADADDANELAKLRAQQAEFRAQQAEFLAQQAELRTQLAEEKAARKLAEKEAAKRRRLIRLRLRSWPQCRSKSARST